MCLQLTEITINLPLGFQIIPRFDECCEAANYAYVHLCVMPSIDRVLAINLSEV